MKKFLSVLLALSMLFACSVSGFADTTGTVYYIDSANGDDAAPGTSAAQAWKTLARASAETYSAGDSILLKAGDIFSGTFTAKGSGTAGMPVTFGSYGDTDKDGRPIIRNDGDGVTMYVKNVSGWTVENIEFTAPDGSGIAVVADNGTQMYDITIRDCTFHDISNKQYVVKYPILLSSEGDTARLNNITVQDCNIYDCGYGLAMHGRSREGTPQWYESPEKSYNRNYIIDGISLDHILYDGIIIMSVCGMVIRNCSLLNTCLVDDHYTAPMWSHHADSFVIENCEIAGALNEMDGMAVDFDGWTTNATYQYCYTHDNVRFISNCCYDNYTCNDNCTVRYCLSVNDNKCGNNMAQLLTAGCQYNEDEYAEAMTNFKFYNNTIINFSEFNLIGLRNASIVNNIFVGRDIASGFRFTRKTYDENNNKVILQFDGTMSNNCFRSCAVPTLAKNSYTCNPCFVGSDVNDKNSFRLCASSGLIGSGVKSDNMGDCDFYGNPLSDSINIGCYGGAGEDVSPSISITDTIRNNIITILASIYNFIYSCNDRYWIF